MTSNEENFSRATHLTSVICVWIFLIPFRANHHPVSFMLPWSLKINQSRYGKTDKMVPIKFSCANRLGLGLE